MVSAHLTTDPGACPRCEELLAENACLRAELATAHAQVAQLRAALAEAQHAREQLEAHQRQLQQELTAVHQAPFRARRRSVQQRTARGPRPRGRPAGHLGVGRKRPAQIDHTAPVPIGAVCPDCGTPFKGRILERERIIEDITPIRPTVVTRYVIERRWCGHCQTFKESPVTAALPNHRLGLHVMLFVVYQKVALGLSYGKIRRELATYFGIPVSPGELPHMVAEVAQIFGPAYARVVRLMRQQAAIHIDETGWRVDGVNHWLWVFVNDVVALYVVSRSRGSKVPQALLGPDFDGVAISDFFSAYGPLDVEKAKCWAHLLRDSHALAQGQPPESERSRFHADLHQLFLDMGVALEEAAADPVARDRVAQEMETQLGAFARGRWRDWDCQRLAQRIRKHLDELLVWLRNPAVSATNNAAERALRPAVITRKTSFGSRSKGGTLDFARLLSLIQTWERQGQDFFAVAHDALVDTGSQN